MKGQAAEQTPKHIDEGHVAQPVTGL